MPEDHMRPPEGDVPGHPLKQKLARTYEWGSETVEPDPPVEHEWHGARLFTHTEVLPITSDDIRTATSEEKKPIESCYDASMIPEEVIAQIVNQRTLIEDLLRQQSECGGMLHGFRVPPYNRRACQPQITKSVYEQMVRALTETEQNKSDKSKVGKKRLYEGAKLVSKENEHDVLAWATWTRSRTDDPGKRKRTDDASVHDVWSLFNRNDPYRHIHLDGDRGYGHFQNLANRALLFDTLNGRVPGAASVLFDYLLPQWEDEYGYDELLLYRHKALQHVSETFREVGKETPRGNNEASYQFFSKRAMSEIGSRWSDFYAQRTITNSSSKKQDVLIASKEGWMWGNIKDIRAASGRIVAAYMQKFSAKS